jgi:hypothetical protein
LEFGKLALASTCWVIESHCLESDDRCFRDEEVPSRMNERVDGVYSREVSAVPRNLELGIEENVGVHIDSWEISDVVQLDVIISEIELDRAF